MSYPIHKKAGSSKARTTRTEKGFWGLELGEDFIERSFSRAVDTENMIWDGASLRIRNGYRKLLSFEERINGIFHYGDQLLVHTGTRLYKQNAAGDQEPILLFEEMADAPSVGVVSKQTVTHRWLVDYLIHGWRREEITGDFLFINDGKNYLFYDGVAVHSIVDPYWGEDVINLIIYDGVVPHYYSTVPFTTVAKLPMSGTGDTDPRGDNRLSQFRCESYYVGTEPQTTFYLHCPRKAYHMRIPEELQVRDQDGVWHSWREYGYSTILSSPTGQTKLILPKVYAGMAFMVEEDGSIINPGAGEYSVADDGMDNFRIIYAVYKEPPDALSGATVQGLYGANNRNNVLFLGGSAKTPGIDAFSAPDDFFCFYETSYEVLGDPKTPVTGYCRLKDGRMAVLKDDDTRAGVHFRSHTTVELGATQSGEVYVTDAFPSVEGAAVAGCINPCSVGVAGNEPCFLSKEGIFSVRTVSDELINLNETVRRSRAVDPFLENKDPKQVRSVCWRGKYLITFGNTALLTDGACDSSGSYRYLKWKFAHEITAITCKNGQLYLGSVDGGVFIMEEMQATDGGIEMEAFWQTPIFEDASGKRLLLRKAHAACTAAVGGSLSVEVYRDGCPEPMRTFSLDVPNFADWDFSKISFSGKPLPEWFSLLSRSISAQSLYFRFILKGKESPLLWGVRVSYEKGGWVK